VASLFLDSWMGITTLILTYRFPFL